MVVRIPFLLTALLLPSQDRLLANEAPAKQQFFTVSAETTRITKPLDAEGYVDYVAAVDETARKGVTPENNYEVVVRQVLGPIHEGEKQVEYFRQIGIQPPPAEGSYYQSYPAFAGFEELSHEHSRLMDEPWTTEEFPKAAEWVDQMNNHLDRLVEGSKRSEYYTPYTVLVDTPAGEETPPLMNVSVESAQNQREIARDLKLRAMQRLGKGDLDGAWDDLQAIRRMSRHVAGGWTAIEALVGCALDSIAFDGEQLVLQSTALSNDQTRRFLGDLQMVPPLPPLAEKWDQGGRLVVLDALQWSIRGNNYAGEIPDLSKMQADLDAVGVSVDWDTAFKTINQFYDRLIDASREEDPTKQRQLFQELDVELHRLKHKYEGDDWKEQVLEANDKGFALGKAFGEIDAYLMCPAFLHAEDAYDRATARLELMRLGFAVELFQRKQTRYPNTLHELTPKYFKTVPVDAMSGDPLVYRATDRGALIYSVGSNLVDDFADTPRGKDHVMDDIMVRVGKPVIPRKGRGPKIWSQITIAIGITIIATIIALTGFVYLKRRLKQRATE